MAAVTCGVPAALAAGCFNFQAFGNGLEDDENRYEVRPEFFPCLLTFILFCNTLYTVELPNSTCTTRSCNRYRGIPAASRAVVQGKVDL